MHVQNLLQWVQGGAQDSAFLTSYQVMPMLLASRQYLNIKRPEDHVTLISEAL